MTPIEIGNKAINISNKAYGAMKDYFNSIGVSVPAFLAMEIRNFVMQEFKKQFIVRAEIAFDDQETAERVAIHLKDQVFDTMNRFVSLGTYMTHTLKVTPSDLNIQVVEENKV